MSLLIQSGLVLTGDGISELDVLVEGDRVVAVGEGLEGEVVIDARGCWVGPGLVDLHAHLREPGQEWKEDIASGSDAAAAGGFTAVVAMPNTTPATDSGHLARFIRERGRVAGKVDVVPAGSVSLGREGQELAHLDELWEAGVRIFTDDGDSIEDAGLLRRAMEYLAERGPGSGVIAQHAEDRGLSASGHMHEGRVSSRLGIRGLPAIAEEVVVARDLALVRLTGARYHVQHVSTVGALDLVRQAKSEGMRVTAEVTPHHLTFTDEMVQSLNPDFKMYPPLRTAADVEALREGLWEGVIDAVATDHAPHAAHECEVPFEEAPRGIIGLETAVSAFIGAMGADSGLLFERMSIGPARVAGLVEHGNLPAPGEIANLVVIDPGAKWSPTSFRSRAQNSPWMGEELTGLVVATIYRGKLSYGSKESR